MVWTIARRELFSLFLSPLAWSVLAVLQFILAYLFLSQVDTFLAIQGRLAGLDSGAGVTSLVAVPLLSTAVFLMLLVTPLLTMRLISEERRNGTLSLLLSAPVSTTQIVAGKFVGITVFLLIVVLLVALMPLSLLAGTGLDLGTFAAGVLGFALVASAFAAAGLYLSSVTDQPTVAAIATFGLLLLLWTIDWAGSARTEVSGFFAYLSLFRHFEFLMKGFVRSMDVVYYLLFTGCFLVLTVRRLEAQRLQG